MVLVLLVFELETVLVSPLARELGTVVVKLLARVFICWLSCNRRLKLLLLELLLEEALSGFLGLTSCAGLSASGTTASGDWSKTTYSGR